MKFLQVAFLFFILELAAVAVAEKISGSENLRILGGQEAPEKYGRFHVSLQDLTAFHLCGGAVISDWFVVTAAHCGFKIITDLEIRVLRLPEEVKLLAGTTRLDEGGIYYDVQSIILHPRYNYHTKENDIALIQSKEPFDNRYITRLPMRRMELQEGDLVTAMGFGQTRNDGPTSRWLLYLDSVPVINQVTCDKSHYPSRQRITRGMVCIYAQRGQGTCFGDSGSPLIIGDELVGVFSWMTLPCASGNPDIYTRITPYIDWIRGYILPSD